MPTTPEFSAEHRIPDGCRARSLCEVLRGEENDSGERPLLDLALIERMGGSDDGSGGKSTLVHVGNSTWGRAVLGAVVDRGGYVHEWLEIWIDESSGDESLSLHNRTTLTAMQSLLPSEWLSVGNLPLTVRLDDIDCAIVGLTRYSPIRLAIYADVLSGKSWAGVFDGAEQLPHGKSLRELSQGLTNRRLSDGLLTDGSGGKQLIEILYLKLRLLADAMQCVADFVQLTKWPLLNLDDHSFRIDLASEGIALPSLWATRIALARPGCALPLTIEGSEHEYYKMIEEPGPSIYRPTSGRATVAGSLTVRIREIIREANDAIIIEGTIDTDEPLRVGSRDLLQIRLPIQNEVVDLYAHIDPEEALTAGETRFRTVTQTFGDAEVVGNIEQLAGVPIDRVAFRIIPLFSTAFDLYSLGIIAIRTLLTDDTQTLAIAVDSILSLKRELDEKMQADDPLPLAIGQLFHQESRWLDVIGPQRLFREDVEVTHAFDVIPIELWMEVLAMIVQLFPGSSAHSTIRDLADGGGHQVFVQPLAALEGLLRKVRSLIIVDWNSNREMHTVIRRLAERL